MVKAVHIAAGDREHEFLLNFDLFRWTSAVELEEADFPLLTVVDGERYELFSDETFAVAGPGPTSD